MPNQVAAVDSDDGRSIALLNLDDSAKRRLPQRVYILSQSHFFLKKKQKKLVSNAMFVFEPHSLPLSLSGIKKYGKQLLPDYGKFILFDAPNHETGTTSSTIG